MNMNYFQKAKEELVNDNYILSYYYIELDFIMKKYENAPSLKEHAIKELENDIRQKAILRVNGIVAKYCNDKCDEYLEELINKDVEKLTEEEAKFIGKEKEWNESLKDAINKARLNLPPIPNRRTDYYYLQTKINGTNDMNPTFFINLVKKYKDCTYEEIVNSMRKELKEKKRKQKK